MALIDKAQAIAQKRRGESISPEKIAQMQNALREKIPDELSDAFERVVVAGTRLMYSEQARPVVIKAFNQEGDVDKKLATNIAGLVMLLDKESGNTIPQQIIIPAGAYLLLEAADVAVKAGYTVTPQDVRDGIDQMTAIIMMKFGANKDQVMQAVGGQPQAMPTGPEAVPANPAAMPAAQAAQA